MYIKILLQMKTLKSEVFLTLERRQNRYTYNGGVRQLTRWRICSDRLRRAAA